MKCNTSLDWFNKGRPQLTFTSMTSFWCFYCWLWTYFTAFSRVSIVDSKLINVSCVFLLIFILLPVQLYWNNIGSNYSLFNLLIYLNIFWSQKKPLNLFSLSLTCNLIIHLILLTRQTVTCPNSTIATLEKDPKYVHS